MDTPTPVVQMSGMSGRTKMLMVVSVLVIIAATVVYFGPRYGIDIGRFFAAEPGALGPPVTNSVKLYPVIDEKASKVQFVLETGDREITGFQFRAGISDAAFANVSGLIGSTVFSQILEPAHLLAGGILSFAAGVSASQPGALSTTTVATIDYSLPADTTAKQICVTVDMTNTIVTAKGLDANALDMTLAGWSNTACIQLITATVTPVPSISSFTATPDSITSGQSSVLSWAVNDATSVSIDNGVGTVTGTSVSVSPVMAKIYTLTATGPGGVATKSVTVSVALPTITVPAPIRGDVNSDGKVDISDFNIVVANFGKTPDSAVLGDENKDGKIDIVDFNAVVTFFGTITK